MSENEPAVKVRKRHDYVPGPPRPRFPDDHMIELLQGYRIPNDKETLRAAVSRCAWLVNKIATHVRLGEPTDLYVKELAALVHLVDVFEGRAPGVAK